MYSRWGSRTSVAYTRSHGYSVVSQAGASLLHPPENGEAQTGAAGTCLSKLRQGWPASLFVGVVGCLVGQDGPHTCFVVPVSGSLRLCLPGGS